MATSKFFTWTKGDKKHAEALRSNYMVPIPVECISIKGLDCHHDAIGTSRNGRKPLPLSFDRTPESSKSARSTRTTESLALQDAAVQSATNLMAVMNDMLRSPQLSSYLSSQSATLRPIVGRARSHTAPTTPLVEAPLREPVELPASTPWQKTPSTIMPSTDTRSTQSVCSESNHAAPGKSIERSRSSPPESTHAFSTYSRQSDKFSRSVSSLQPPIDPVSRPKMTSPLPRRFAFPDVFAASEETLSGPGNAGSGSIPSSSNNTASNNTPTISHHASHPMLHQLNNEQSMEDAADVQSLTHGDAAFMDQVTTIRASHEAHLHSLKQAHERELASNRTYIAFLEQRQIVTARPQQPPRHLLTIDTSQAGGRGGGLLSSDASATASQHSFDSSLESRPRASSEALAETEALKRKLSLCRKAQADFGDVRRERDTLRDASDNDHRRIAQLKDIVRKAKDNDKSLRTAIADLESRLQSANDQRTDVLEGYHVACEKVTSLSQNEHKLLLTIEQLRSKLSPGDILESAPVHGNQASNTASLQGHENSFCHEPEKEAEELRRILLDKDARIGWLERQAMEHTSDTGAKDTSFRSALLINTQLEQDLTSCKQKLQMAEADRDKFNALLHSELRRQSRNAAKKAVSLTPRVVDEAAAMAAERISSATAKKAAQAEVPHSYTTQQTITTLEAELKHCMQEIVMYKLDIRGYKKDLRKANAEIESLRGVCAQRPPTPEYENSSGVEKPPDLSTEPETASGLGISMPAQPDRRTPMKDSVASATAEVLLSVPSTPPSVPSVLHLTPDSRPKTPLGTRKKLPRPPARTASPYLVAASPSEATKLQRAETLRSLSESIISSYAKRSTIGLDSVAPASPTPTLPRDRSSDPPKPRVASVRMIHIIKGGGEQHSMKSQSKATSKIEDAVVA